MNCILEGLFPASEAQVHLALGNQTLNSTVESHGDTISATATAVARAEQEGAQEIVCNITLGNDGREAREKLTVYSKRGRSQEADPEGKGRGFGVPGDMWAGTKREVGREPAERDCDCRDCRVGGA